MLAIWSLSAGCLIELEGEPAWMWCLEATGANGTRASSGGTVNITRAGDWVSFCGRYCEWEHTILQQGEHGDYDVTHPLHGQWQDLREGLYHTAEVVCEERVDELESGGAIIFSGPGDVTCNTAVHTQSSEFWKIEKLGFTKGTCDEIGNETGAGQEGAESTAGPPTSGGPDADSSGTGSGVVGPVIYGLSAYSQVLSCSTSGSLRKITCSIDEDSVRYLADNDTLLWQDDATLHEVTVGSVRGWQFDACGSGSLMYAAGFRRGDTITSVEGTPVQHLSGAILALGQFGNPLFGGSTVSGTFYRGSTLWTFVANRVNNHPRRVRVRSG